MSEQAYAAPKMHAQELKARPRRPEDGSPLGALALAGGCLLALAAIWMIAELVPAAHTKDAVILGEFVSLNRPRLETLGNFLLHLLNPSLFILWGIALVAVALAREQPRVAIAVVAVLCLAPLTADILKPLLAHQHEPIGYVRIGAASWPSGHSTAATSLALCAVLVSPPSIRTAVATVGAIFVLAVGGALLMLAWHMPSDVVGGWFVAALWVSLALAALRAAERWRPTGPPRRDHVTPPEASAAQ
jgi:membrane-associated phospholipid phosphatase